MTCLYYSDYGGRSAVRLRRSCFAVDQPTGHTTKWLGVSAPRTTTIADGPLEAALPARADTVDYSLVRERPRAADAGVLPRAGDGGC
jgi:hypothetical protein